MSDEKTEQKFTLGRTGIVTLVIGGFILVALGMCLRGGASESSAGMLSTVVLGLVTLALGKAGQSTLEAISTGTGLKGIKRAILTDAKPGTPDSTKVTETVEVTATKAAP